MYYHYHKILNHVVFIKKLLFSNLDEILFFQTASIINYICRSFACRELLRPKLINTPIRPTYWNR